MSKNNQVSGKSTWTRLASAARSSPRSVVLGFPALLSILSAIGLGFLINDAILTPLLVGFLITTLAGSFLGMRHHGNPWALILGAVSTLTTFVFIAVVFNQLLAGIVIAGLIAASFLNVLLRVREMKR
jgi:mercuric ion transport protein